MTSAPSTFVSSTPVTAPSPGRRLLWAGPLVAVVSMLCALACVDDAGIGLRDPDNVMRGRLLVLFALVAALVVLDVWVRARRATGAFWPSRAQMAAVRAEKWPRSRCVLVGTAIVSFYVSYLAYRNMKSVVPLIRRGDLYDSQLAGIDRAMFLGHDPAALMHSVLGTGLFAHGFSGVYLLFFAYIPGTLALALVFSPRVQAGIFYATAQSFNWLLGAGSYFLFPSLGPVYHKASEFTALPKTSSGDLQDLLIRQRTHYIADPHTHAAQSIAAFASLHIAIYLTGALTVHLLGMSRRWKLAAWFLLAITTGSTIYLGWHYFVDDIAGAVIAVCALLLARAVTGFSPRAERAVA